MKSNYSKYPIFLESIYNKKEDNKYIHILHIETIVKKVRLKTI